jgi:transposase InsO family protein
MSTDYSLGELCEAFDVSRSGYHAWAGRQPCARIQADAQLQPLIAAAHAEGRKEYGSPRVVRWLRQHGHRCSRRRIGRLMRQMGLAHRSRRRFKPMSLTDSHHDLPIAPNLLPQRVPTLQPDTVWVADITYVPTDEGWLYVAGVLDRCTRRCIGWAMGDTLATTLPLAALDMALKHAAIASLVNGTKRTDDFSAIIVAPTKTKSTSAMPAFLCRTRCSPRK